MKYIKKFENLNFPEVGEYVICEADKLLFNNLNDFLLAHVGQLIKIGNRNTMPYVIEFDVLYDDFPELKNYRATNYSDELKKLRIEFSRKEIIYISKDKEYLESILATNKYNL